ncbi:MAG: hypothetical protein AAF578_09715 [Pseudomonadota bacterium]
MTDLILHNGKITTLDPVQPEVQAMLIRNGGVANIGGDGEVLADGPHAFWGALGCSCFAF